MSNDMLDTGKRGGTERMTASSIRCFRESCDRTANCFVENHFLCLTHFISHCYERLEECRATPFGNPDPAHCDADVRFLRECCERAANLVPPVRGLDNLERARLFDIFLWASELLAKHDEAVARKRAAHD